MCSTSGMILKRRFFLFFSHRFKEDRNGTQTTQYITTQGLLSPWPDALIVQVSSSSDVLINLHDVKNSTPDERFFSFLALKVVEKFSLLFRGVFYHGFEFYIGIF
jgi:hypothetical protein